MLNRIFFFGIFFSVVAGARTYNYQEIPVGERSAGMGMSSMAIEGDTGQMFTNPATLAHIPFSQFSASVSAYSRIDTRTGEFVSIFESAKDNITRTGFLAIPSMVGGHLRTKSSWVWGGTALVPYSYANSGTLPVAPGIGSFEAKDESYWYGMFLARRVGEKHAFGLSVFYASRSSTEKFFFVGKPDGVNLRVRYFEEGFGAGGVVTIFGGTYNYSDTLRFGYSFRPPAIFVGGESFVLDAANDPAIAARDYRDRTSFYPLPMRLSFGASWKPRADLTLASDLHAYTSLKGNLGNGQNAELDIDARSIVNFSFGAEYMGWHEIGIRSGFYTNMSAARKVPIAFTTINDKVHMFGGTLAIVFDKKEGSISLGGYIQGGQGRGPALSEEPVPVPRTNYVYGAVIGSSYKFL